MELVFISKKPISRQEQEKRVLQRPEDLSFPPKCVFKGLKFRTCRCIRQNYFNIKGFHTRFTLQTEQTNRLHAKCKLFSKNKKVSICENREPHLGKNPDSTIIFNTDLSHFSLFNGSVYGKELMSVNITKLKNQPRAIEIHFFNNAVDSKLPQEMRTAKPILVCGIRWCVDLHAKTVLLSNKNCCIEDSGSSNPYFFVRKISEDVLEIEANQAISDMIVFSLGIISFIGK